MSYSETAVAALEYAIRGWAVFPALKSKKPLTVHGHLDAVADPRIVREWWQHWPEALVGIATGKHSGLVALDVDVRAQYSGFDTLDELGRHFHPVTPTAHTPSGGVHMLFRWPGFHVPTTPRLGKGLDVRGDGGSLILPPGPGRFWDPILDLKVVGLARWPELFVRLLERPVTKVRRKLPHGNLRGLSKALLGDAARKIRDAPEGKQELTLHGQCFRIGRLIRDGVLPYDICLHVLQAAGRQMRSHDPRRPWRPSEIDAKVARSLSFGINHVERFAG